MKSKRIKCPYCGRFLAKLHFTKITEGSTAEVLLELKCGKCRRDWEFNLAARQPAKIDFKPFVRKFKAN